MFPVTPKLSHGHEGLLFVNSKAEDADFCPNFPWKGRNIWDDFLSNFEYTI